MQLGKHPDREPGIDAGDGRIVGGGEFRRRPVGAGGCSIDGRFGFGGKGGQLIFLLITLHISF
jgi:hypothetical protein